VLDVDVAIKLISLTHRAEAPAMSQRLLDEARAAARLGHPSIVRVHDFGQTHVGDPFIAMELLDGEDLADVLTREGALEPVAAVQLLLPIAHALATAHDKAIVHCDVKPENIFLMPGDGGVVPKLLDFGIARMLDSPEQRIGTGAVLGTPDYMSPEQARGEDAGPASDIWSFCVVLYEAVCGSCPFEGEDAKQLFQAIAEQPALPPEGVDASLWAILARGLVKDPAERWGSMRELGEALALWLFDQGVTEDVVGTSTRRAWLREAEAAGKIEPAPARQSNSGAERFGSEPGSGLRTLPEPIDAAASAPSEASPPASVPEINGQASEPQLEALASLGRGGDPVDVMRRAEQRRVLLLALTATTLAAALALGILIGTGIIAW
jgi:serine/threonine-protein kinase